MSRAQRLIRATDLLDEIKIRIKAGLPKELKIVQKGMLNIINDFQGRGFKQSEIESYLYGVVDDTMKKRTDIARN